jgi:hypothetical protein
MAELGFLDVLDPKADAVARGPHDFVVDPYMYGSIGTIRRLAAKEFGVVIPEPSA